MLYLQKQGLYDPQNEHDACGVGFIAHLKGQATHEMVEQGIHMLTKLHHRGGVNDGTGDGAGILLQIPHLFFQYEFPSLPKVGQYGVGMIFFPQEEIERNKWEKKLESLIEQEGQEVIGWRDVPTDPSTLSTIARESAPVIRQVVIGCEDGIDQLTFERKLYVIRKQYEKLVNNDVYVVSLSSRTIVYKGLLTAFQLGSFYLDLQAENFTSAFSMVHNRFSTNTFPSWKRSHPYRYLLHNGEINTLRGNVNWMFAREKAFASDLFGDDLEKVLPVLDMDGTDSAILDNCFEFLVLSGRSLAHAAMMMIPEAWEKNEEIVDPVRAFYEYHSSVMEPWDGPTAIAFTDGTQIGAILDRNGLRPGRYCVTKDDYIVFSSEVGVMNIPEENIRYKKRLRAGQTLLVDLAEGRIIGNKELKEQVANQHPYRDWLTQNLISLKDIPARKVTPKLDKDTLFIMQKTNAYTWEELHKSLLPMVTEGKDPIGSMGSDTPLAVLSERPQLLYNYFKQSFAQVTNPPIDAIREASVTSTTSLLGAEGNLLEPHSRDCQKIRLETPILSDVQLGQIANQSYSAFRAETIPMLFSATDLKLEEAMEEIFAMADQAIEDGKSLLILSDRQMNEKMAPIPSLLAVSGLHHHLVRSGTRTKVSIIAETSEARDVHQLSMLISYGVDAVNPYLVFATLEQAIEEGSIKGMGLKEAVGRYIQAATEGIVKVMSKMGISTVQSYRGAQIFEAVGIDEQVLDYYFTRTPSQLGGINLGVIAKETVLRHTKAYESLALQMRDLEAGSDFQWRRTGEIHAFAPQTIHTLQQACRKNDYTLFKKYTEMANKEQLIFLRHLLDFNSSLPSVPLEEVEPVESIVKRFKTGAMSFGALSQEAHETLAIAMNRLGGKSNSGEGGEHPSRHTIDENGDSRSSSIKQVASGRFGVSSDYLVHAKEIQIKMAQGAKPGEGGQLPGSKVYPWIAKVRNSTPGVGLISPPPHHDIYSIEDLAELIYDLKNANRDARISVKLVAKAGVGTIATGVAKAMADVIVISGHDGGTGASPKTSMKHAGLPWELGLAETHQTLLLNNLRDRVILETDGKLMTGRDVVMAAVLGAEEFGFSTAPLVVMGCIMMRACHLDTCPVGIATQNPELRGRFAGDADHVVHFMRFIAQEVREIMASLGFRTLDEMVGRTDILTAGLRHQQHWKAKYLDLSTLLYRPATDAKVGSYYQKLRDHQLETTLDIKTLLPLSASALQEGRAVHAVLPITNTNRVVGSILGSEVTKKYGGKGLPDHTIKFHFQGSAGVSFGAFVPKGITLSLEGDANDYIGKGLSGGKVIVYPSRKATFASQDNVIVGNAAFYGATSGEAYISGIAGERFAVRNSGVHAVVEGVGDHGCEYMTGGRVVVLGSIGKNFAAGMSGGIAYVFAEDIKSLSRNCNREMVLLESVATEQERIEVKQLIQKHAQYTRSQQAKQILNNWEMISERLIRIIPKEYKQILERETNKKMEIVTLIPQASSFN
ncbi:glutamate synthase large subunit [Shimazuella sp. AN120528]|uniref:glutamate synthase large subunit n=1 Tax=Shimazuella soli TaxID=1892854 RepID=UPI001F0E8EEF|nr:glutamate synthase large subunit [Shimazuella soli]MCH5584322.1 glutamate synthase large subunit [Shimazuella soli]